MIPAPTLDEVTRMLNQDSVRTASGFLLGIDERIRVLGVLLVPPDTAEQNTANLLSNIGLLSNDSGSKFHFLLVGISQYGGEKEVGRLYDARLYFNERNFIDFKSALEANMRGWEYDYSLELLLFDLIGEKPNRSIDYKNYINFKLDELVRAEVFNNPSQILGKIIKLARETKLQSAKEIQGYFKDGFGENWLKALILSLFPKSIQKLARVSAVLGGGRAQITLGD